ncbi:MAG: putative 2OG-Fe(II) oxygenase [Synechococcaceae cyanobacterium]|nr:putative 2OG-Fe(II) oxygenase [Synechococcaceae cyanobacterium]
MSARLQLRSLFPLALGQVQLQSDPLDLALHMQAIRDLQAGALSNPDPGCAWTGDLNGIWQLHRQQLFQPLVAELMSHAWAYLESVGFARERLALHIQRCWPVVSELGQVVGRHHHPNAHLSGVYYLNGDGSGRSGCLRLFPRWQPNELVPGLAVGHGGPIQAGSEQAAGWNAPWLDIAPRAGLLLLFPSHVDHAVLENEDPDDSRFSISFDLALTAPARPAETHEAAEYLAPHPSAWQALEVGGSGRMARASAPR